MTVQELFTLVLPRLETVPRCSLMEAAAAVQSIAFKHLFAMRSDLIQADYDVDFGVDEPQAQLPDTFYAVASRPEIVGGQTFLSQADRTKVLGLSAGTPRFYDLRGRLMTVYPTPVADVVIRVPSFVKPLALESMDDDLPFDGWLDDVFADCCVAYMSSGEVGPADRGFAAFVVTQLDTLLKSRELNDEQATADAINYGPR